MLPVHYIHYEGIGCHRFDPRSFLPARWATATVAQFEKHIPAMGEAGMKDRVYSAAEEAAEKPSGTQKAGPGTEARTHYQ
jgi:hypothetical protein